MCDSTDRNDINYIDVTTDYLVDENSVSTAKYVSKDEGVLCGIDVAMRVFQLLDSNIKCEIFIHDGEKVKKGDIIAKKQDQQEPCSKAKERH